MTLKARLTAALAVIVVVAATALAIIAVRTVESSLLTQVDQRLVDAASRPLLLPPPSDSPDQGAAPTQGAAPDEGAAPTQGAAPDQGAAPTQGAAPGSDRPGGPAAGLSIEGEGSTEHRTFADLLFEPDGTPVLATASGFSGDEDPLPDLDATTIAAMVGIPTTVESIDGGLEYRAIATRLLDGRFHVIADPLADEQAIAARVRNLAALGGVLVVLGAAALSWWVVRRELRPVDQMIDTAGRIAEGDLSLRIDHHRPGTELDRLARSLDDMINELESAFEDRRAGEERLRRFAADASHELRTPLAAISGYAELYRRGGIPSGEPLDTALGRIESESARMTRLVEDLLLLARLDQQLPLEQAEVDLAALAREAARDLGAIDPTRPVTVSADDPSTVVGDERRLRQVVANLLSNVVHHTPPGTAVRLSAIADGDVAVIEVADDGPGIPAELRDRVFERFYRVDKSRRVAKNGTGAGLGLSIVARIVDAHGGTVEVGDRPGGGTVFRVRLPLAPVGDVAAPVTA